MSFLQKAREKASEVARDAADATSRAADAVATKAQDPGTQSKVKTGLASAGRSAADASAKAADAVVSKAQDPATQARVKGGLKLAGRSARTMVERIDPGILAEVVIKATALQEKANARLRQKGSIYRIGELQVTASIPPGISFTILRVDDPDDPATAADLHTSSEILASEATTPEASGGDAPLDIVSLDGEEQAAIAFELAETEASLEATVEALVAPEEPPARA